MTTKEIKKRGNKMNVKTEIKVYIDGGTKRNGSKDAISGIGLYIPSMDVKKYRRVNETTNNRAELTALLVALDYCEHKNLFDSEITIYSDSLLIVNQYNGEYKIKSNLDLWNLIKKYRSVNMEWISRNENSIADELANKGCKCSVLTCWTYCFSSCHPMSLCYLYTSYV